jgi:hypothetical protein
MYLLNYYGQQWPFPQGASGGPYPEFLPVRQAAAGLGWYRPNVAMYRGTYAGTSRTLGDTTIDPTAINLTDPGTLLMIAGAGFVLWTLFKGARGVKRGVSRGARKIRRGYRRRGQALSQAIF